MITVDAVHKPKAFFKARVLVVDDNNVNQAVAQRMLKKLGVEVVDVAADGQEAIDKLVDEVRMSKADRDYLKQTLKQRRDYIIEQVLG